MLKRLSPRALWQLLVVTTLTLLFSLPLIASASDIPSVDIGPRIVGGYEATPGAWPWTAALVETGQEPGDGQFCGGTLVSDTWIVTAAHCVEGETTSSIEVYLGLHDLRDDGEKHSISRIISHPKYDSETEDYDIALIELDSASAEQPLDVIPQGDPSGLADVGVTATTVGWGRLTQNGYASWVLMEVQVPILSTAVAETGYGTGRITENMIPAGYMEGGKDSCQGDSGGPLMVPNEARSSWVLAGVTSWGDGCAKPNKPGVYTRVSQFHDWIEAYVDNGGSGTYVHEGYIPYATYKTDEWTAIALSNVNNDSANPVIVEYYTNSGELLGSTSLEIPAHGQTNYMCPYADTAHEGWIKVRSDKELNGLALIGGPGDKSVYDVDMKNAKSTSMLIGHIGMVEGVLSSILKVCNPSSTAMTLTLSMFKGDGAQATPDRQFSVPANGASQIVLNDYYGDINNGSLKITASGAGGAAFLLYDGTSALPYYRVGLSAVTQ